MMERVTLALILKYKVGICSETIKHSSNFRTREYMYEVEYTQSPNTHKKLVCKITIFV